MESSSSLSLPLSEPFRAAAAMLLTAFDYATDSGADRWEFAVEMRDLLAAGATIPDLRWLIHRNFADHAKETTTPGDPARSFRPLARTSFPIDACLALTPQGAESLRAAIAATRNDSQRSEVGGQKSDMPGTADLRAPTSDLRPPTSSSPDPRPLTPDPSAAERPLWDPLRRELRYAGQVIKRYRVPAPNQELILTAFQEEGWPEYIDDPLPPEEEVASKHRLQVTIKSLNRNQIGPLIRFHGNGKGLQVCWEPNKADFHLEP